MAPGTPGGPFKQRKPNPPELQREIQAIVRVMERGLFYQARFRTNIAISRFGSTGQLQCIMGLTYHKDKQYAIAKPYFLKAIDQEPEYAAPYYFLGYCHYYLGEPEQARAAFEKHLALTPDVGDSYFGIGLCELEAGRLPEARRAFTKAIELNGKELALNPAKKDLMRDIAKCHARLADVALGEDKVETARDELVLATRQWPDHYEAWHKLNLVLMRLGDKAGAEEAMRQYDLAIARVRGPAAAPGAAPPPTEGGSSPASPAPPPTTTQPAAPRDPAPSEPPTTRPDS